jgi:plasmid stabilization system protein ParE
MQIRWSPEAAADLERICERIAIDSPDVAARVAGTIHSGCGRLKEFPRSGRTSRRMPGWRELVFPSLPYIVVYLVTDEAAEITRIFHGAQDWP